MNLRLKMWTIYMLKMPDISSWLYQFMPVRIRIWRYNYLRKRLLKQGHPEIVATVRKYFPEA